MFLLSSFLQQVLHNLTVIAGSIIAKLISNSILVKTVFRIQQSALNSIGLGNTPAEQFQLWRNGEEVSLYTSAATGPLGPSGYIEFWGLMNDGKKIPNSAGTPITSFPQSL